MMQCPEVRDLLPAHVVGDLDAWRRDKVLDHAEACADCRAELEALQATADLVATAPAPPSSQRRVDRAAAALPASAPRPMPWYAPWLAWTAVAAAALLAVSRPISPPPPSSPMAPPALVFAATQVYGTVESQAHAAAPWRPLQPESTVGPGSRLRTRDGSRCLLTSATQGRILLDEDSMLGIATTPAGAEEDVLNLYRGALRADLRRRPGKDLYVDCSAGRLLVSGAVFDLEYR